ncbi:hypothetical protein BTHERMOSOX_1810 [Bathymodiolus thermophilus thioautotrophic gill symbiont]|nr:hypothetical protein BTHERMOSOX_1810 [Bathymodiolus thermophilus thioautotrophic gill symbiont]
MIHQRKHIHSLKIYKKYQQHQTILLLSFWEIKFNKYSEAFA